MVHRCSAVLNASIPTSITQAEAVAFPATVSMARPVPPGQDFVVRWDMRIDGTNNGGDTLVSIGDTCNGGVSLKSDGLGCSSPLIPPLPKHPYCHDSLSKYKRSSVFFWA